MQRRRFLKTAAGIFVPAACGIVRAQPFQLNDPALLAATRPKSQSSCVAKDTYSPPGASQVYFGNTHKAVACLWVPSSSYTVCKVIANLWLSAATSATMSAAVYNEVSFAPGSIIGTGSASIAMSSVPGFNADGNPITFTGMSASVTSGTNYWMVIQIDGAVPNADNICYWVWNGTTVVSGVKYTLDLSAWTDAQSKQGIMSVYG